MKKLVLLLAVVFGVSFVSCNKADQAAAGTDSAAQDSAVVEEVAPAANDSAAEVAPAADSAAVEAAPAEEAK